jgi:aspartate/tyrosine/aromatic aminotransferase
VLPVVVETEREYVADLAAGKENKEYDPIPGFLPFRRASVQFLYGDAMPDMRNIAHCVSMSGTGGLRIAAEFLASSIDPATPVYFSAETWPNHGPIFTVGGLPRVRAYRYFDKGTAGLNFRGMLQDLTKAPDGAVVVFHLCGHNPTGVDPTREQWEALCDLSFAKHFRVIFDSAYQGYASGDLNIDAFAARLFAKKGLDLIACQSYSKNMGLYGDRLGCFSMLCSNADSADRVQRFINAKIIRPMYSSAPVHPARIAHRILSNPKKFAQWEAQIKVMSLRILRMRKMLYDELVRLDTPGTWEHITKQIGMFSYLGLTPKQCRRLVRDFHMYLLETGRANMAGLTDTTALKLGQAIDIVVRGASTPVEIAAKLFPSKL